MTDLIFDDELSHEVKQLVQSGNHAQAAKKLLDSGYPARAGALFEKIFDYDNAFAAYQTVGDLASALRVAIAQQIPDRIQSIVETAIERRETALLLAPLQKAGRDYELGILHEARLDYALAAASFQRAMRLDRAADCALSLGDLRQAGVLLEKHLEQNAHDADATAKLGAVLSRFSRHDDAIRLLQQAVRLTKPAEQHDMLCRVSPTMALCFVGLGYEEAARTTLLRWAAAAIQAGKPAPPDTVEKLLASGYGQAMAFFLSGSSSTLDGESGVNHFAGDMRLAGRYILGEPLGGGGIGQTFRAYDAFLDQPVVVRIFGAQAMQSESIALFARDARAVQSLGHAAVVPLVEMNLSHGFAVSVFTDWPSLEQKLRNPNSATSTSNTNLANQTSNALWLLSSMRMVLDLLAESHRIGVVHGGLKPTNVFVGTASVRVADFGAHHLMALRSTETGSFASMWPYQSPAQLLGADATVSDDLYAVAAMLYRALVGVPPFTAAEANRQQLPPLASSRNPDIPAAWDVFLQKALHPDVKERFQDAASLRIAMPDLPSSFVLPSATTRLRARVAEVNRNSTYANAYADMYADTRIDLHPTNPADLADLADLADHTDLVENTDFAGHPAAHSSEYTTSSGMSSGMQSQQNNKERYQRGALVDRPTPHTKILEARDVLLSRDVYILETADIAFLEALRRCSPILRGMQHVYDVHVDEQWAVLSRDHIVKKGSLLDETAAQEIWMVPQGLMRDLSAVAEALEKMHAADVAFGGFAVERMQGLVGPQLQIVPGLPLLADAASIRSVDAVQADWQSFCVAAWRYFTEGAQKNLSSAQQQSPNSVVPHVQSVRRDMLIYLADHQLIDDVDALVGLLQPDQSGLSWSLFFATLAQELSVRNRARLSRMLGALGKRRY